MRIRYNIVNENGELLAGNKTEKGVRSWIKKHALERIGERYFYKKRGIAHMAHIEVIDTGGGRP